MPTNWQIMQAQPGGAGGGAGATAHLAAGGALRPTAPTCTGSTSPTAGTAQGIWKAPRTAGATAVQYYVTSYPQRAIALVADALSSGYVYWLEKESDGTYAVCRDTSTRACRRRAGELRLVARAALGATPPSTSRSTRRGPLTTYAYWTQWGRFLGNCSQSGYVVRVSIGNGAQTPFTVATVNCPHLAVDGPNGFLITARRSWGRRPSGDPPARGAVSFRNDHHRKNAATLRAVGSRHAWSGRARNAVVRSRRRNGYRASPGTVTHAGVAIGVLARLRSWAEERLGRAHLDFRRPLQLRNGAPTRPGPHR